MAKNIAFKADQDGLILDLNGDCDFSLIKTELQKKFQQGADFFEEDMIIKINVGDRYLSLAEKRELLELFKSLPGISVIEFINNQTNFNLQDKEETLLIKRTLRSGQSVSSEGNIVIQGDINPGAEVIAGKDILVLGEVRGTAHAGFSGDLTSTITAFRLRPLQLRIADIISRAPDDSLEGPEAPEIAFIESGKIMIDYLG